MPVPDSTFTAGAVRPSLLPVKTKTAAAVRYSPMHTANGGSPPSSSSISTASTPAHTPRRRSSLYMSANASGTNITTPDPPTDRSVSSSPHLSVCADCRTDAVGSAVDSELPPSPPFNRSIENRRSSSSSPQLVGSYEESLLSGRMSSLSSKPVEFQAKIRVSAINSSDLSPNTHRYGSLHVPFDAVFFDWGGKEESPPYVGGLDIEQAVSSDSVISKSKPGFRIPRRGRLQIIVYNPQQTAVQIFLVPYDLRNMPSNRKTLVRQRKVTAGSTRNIIQAIQFQVVAPPSTSKLYIHGKIRLVFQNRVLLASSFPSRSAADEPASTLPSGSPSSSTASLLAPSQVQTDLCYGGFSIWHHKYSCANCGATIYS